MKLSRYLKKATGIIFVTLLAGLLTLLMAFPVSAHGYVDQSCETNYFVAHDVILGSPIGQEFVPTQATLCGFDVYLVSTYGNNVTVNLRQGTITSPVIASSSGAVAQGFNGWKHFDMATPVPVVPGQKYVMEVQTNAYYLHWIAGSGYSEGNYIVRGSARPEFDGYFRSYYLPPVQPPSVTLSYPNGGEILRGTSDIRLRISQPQGKRVVISMFLNGVALAFNGGSVVQPNADGSPVDVVRTFDTTTKASGKDFYRLKVVAALEENPAVSSEVMSAAPFSIDNSKPFVGLPANEQAPILEQTTYAGTPFTFHPMVSDSMDPAPVLTVTGAQAFYPRGTSTVVFTATDWAGNSSSVSANVDVRDTKSPSINPPPGVIVNGGDPVNLGNPTVLDIGDPQPTVTNNAPAVFPVGVTIVTWTARDASGNSASATQTVTVLDTIPPTIVAPPNIIAEMTSPAGATINLGSPNVSDNADPSPVVTNDAFSSILDQQQTSSNFSTFYIDGTGATGARQVSQTFIPSVTGQLTQVRVYMTAGSSPVTMTIQNTPLVVSGGIFTNPPLATVTIPAPTSEGWQSFNFSSPAPVTAGQQYAFVLSSPGRATFSGSFSNPYPGGYIWWSDNTPNYGIDMKFQTYTGFGINVFPQGTTTVTWTARDASGNTAIATQTITVQDTIAPVVTAPVNITKEATDPQTPVAVGQATATDAVGVVSITSNAPATFPVGVTRVTWIATDAAGNVGTATQVVTIQDTTPPTITAPANITAEMTSPNGAIVNLGTPIVSDIADPTLLVSHNAPPVFPRGVTTVIWTVSDDSGNIATASQTVTVQDTTRPAITAPPNIIAEMTSPAGATVDLGTPVVSDIADPSPVVTNDVGSSTFPKGITTVTWTARDASGNTATATQTVTVRDTIAPVVTAPVNITKEATGPQTPVAVGQATATDAVGVVSITSNAPATFPVGVTRVTWIATDAAGNASTATQVVTIQDTIPPVITGAPTTAPNSNGWYNGNVTVHFNATDSGSGIASVTPDITLSTEGSTQSVTGVAIDKAGNSASTTVSNINIDRTGPVVTIASPVARDYLTSESVTLSFSATDAMSGMLTTVATLDGNVVTSGQLINLAAKAGSHTLVVTATDKAGNVQTASVTFYVVMTSTVNLDPNTLNLKSQGGSNSFTAYIELPSGYDVNQVNVGTVKMNVNGTIIVALLTPTSVGDNDGDKILERMVKFDRQLIIKALAGNTGDITMTITGQLNDGRRFSGTGTLKVTNPGK